MLSAGEGSAQRQKGQRPQRKPDSVPKGSHVFRMCVGPLRGSTGRPPRLEVVLGEDKEDTCWALSGVQEHASSPLPQTG